MFLSSTIIAFNKKLLIVLVALVLCLPAFGQAAQVQVLPASGTYDLEQTFTVSVHVIPTGDSVNALEANLKFDPSILSVVEISTTDSLLTRWTIMPTFSNSLGTIEFAGVSEAPLTVSSNLLNITFKALASGSGDLTVANASVFATDGLRTDLFENGDFATFIISSSPENTATLEVAKLEIPAVETITSDVFVDSALWYDVATGTFSWLLPADTEAVAVEVTNNPSNRPNNNPKAIYESPISEFTITADDVTDGVHYLNLRFRSDAGWGEVFSRQVLIDTTPPETFALTVDPAEVGFFPTLYFEAVDFTSGIVGYEIAISGQEPIMITPDKVKSGYQLSGLEDGTYQVTVTAFDRAGNDRVVNTEVTVSAGWVATVADKQMQTQTEAYLKPANLSIYVLAIIIILLLIHVHFERKQMKIKEERLTKETHDIQAQMEKIFSALRDEIYDQINTITKRKRLSKAEKEAVEGLNQAIEVSETLIEKEINDVKSILK